MSSTGFQFMQTKFWTILHTVVKWLMITGSVVSTACMVYSVILRYVFKGNFYGSDEVIMLFAFWLYFMGAVYGSYENSHIKADLLNVYIKNIRAKDVVALLAEMVTIVVNIIVLIWAIRFFQGEIVKGGLSTALKIPLVIPKSAVFFGFLLMAFYHVTYFIRDVYRLITVGYFTEPNPGDYASEKLKAKYPNITLPTKEEAKALLAQDLQREDQEKAPGKDALDKEGEK